MEGNKRVQHMRLGPARDHRTHKHDQQMRLGSVRDHRTYRVAFGRTLSGQDRAGQLTVVPQPFAVSSPERQRPAQLERFRRPVAKPQRSAQVLGAVSAVSTVRTSAFRGES